MRRFAAQIAGLALCASALGGCSVFGDGDASSAPPRDRTVDSASLNADVTSAVRQAQTLRLKGDLEGATRILSQLMLAQPDDARVVGEYGKLLVQEGHTGDAIQFLRRAIELQPNDWTLYSALGVAYDQSNDQANARDAYEHGLALKPGEAALLNNYAMSRMLAGDTVGARTLMQQAQAAGSSDPRIARTLARLDSVAPQAPVAPVRTATAPASGAPFPPVTASVVPPANRAPLPIAAAPTVVLGQPVGPNGVTVKPATKPTKTAKVVKPSKAGHATRGVAANTPPAKQAKPVKTAKVEKPAKPSAKDHIPALRMTADAGKP